MNPGFEFLAYILPAVSFGFAAAVQPGPLSLYLISQTLKNGWRQTLPAIFAPLITDGPIGLLCLFILSKLPLNFIQYIQVAGGIFILYLASRAFISWKKYHEAVAGPASSSGKTFLNAVLVNFLNPGPYMGWSLVIGPLFLKGWKENAANGITLLAAFYLTMFLVSAVLIILFQLGHDRGPRLQRALIGLSSLALALFGLYEIIGGSIAILKD
jgi:threonine/homoserine/homoserine lactone efflux protein